jgi:hypothetical protein
MEAGGLMSDPIKAALIGLAGVALCGPLMVFILNWLITRSSKLVVTVTVHSGFKSRKLVDEVSNYVKRAKIGDDDWKKQTDIQDRWRGLLMSGWYTRVTLYNNSKKKLSNLTISLANDGYVQVEDDGEVLGIKGGVPMVLGELQPHREMLVHVVGLYGTNYIGMIKQRLRLSADELGRVAYKFPLPEHLKNRYVFWGATLLPLMMLAFMLLLYR